MEQPIGSCDLGVLGVEIQTPRRETAHFQKNEHDFGSVVNVGRELIGIPAEELVAGIRID